MLISVLRLTVARCNVATGDDAGTAANVVVDKLAMVATGSSINRLGNRAAHDVNVVVSRASVQLDHPRIFNDDHEESLASIIKASELPIRSVFSVLSSGKTLR